MRSAVPVAAVTPLLLLLQWDAEVRDRALGLVEDFGRGLPMPAYKEAYESLLVRRWFPCAGIMQHQHQQGQLLHTAAHNSAAHSPCC